MIPKMKPILFNNKKIPEMRFYAGDIGICVLLVTLLFYTVG